MDIKDVPEIVYKIIAIVCAEFGVKKDNILGYGRRAFIVTPRHAAMALVRRKTQLSYPVIGWVFGNRNHSTVISNIKKLGKMRTVDHALDRRIMRLDERIDRELHLPESPDGFIGANI